MKESEGSQKQQVAAVFGRAAPTYDRTPVSFRVGPRQLADLAT